ncbi:hypothetical protein M419DRAFT_82397 [Trichoderma reesei RUT C-30]|uniref:MIT domain-containing protein n=1 Tax=Hypocrea jecorina (strain ATCC 56765 / BCRC 32924 / NRRL 11460 / Rut C-30) TaxID=1344414 RepID=A0A024S910_HYPJR|nr:hypothetical protein M419DRAFT_82397 [Trichoderma reesei RUT C-30]
MQQPPSLVGDRSITGLGDAASRPNLSSSSPTVTSAPSAPTSPPPRPPISLNPPSREPPGVEPVLRITPVPRSVFASVHQPRKSSLVQTSHVLPSPRTAAAAHHHHPVSHSASGSSGSNGSGSGSGSGSGNLLRQTHRDTVHPPVKRPSTPSSHPTRGASTGASPQQGASSRNRSSTSPVSSPASRTPPYASRQASVSHSRQQHNHHHQHQHQHYHSHTSSTTSRASIEAVVGAVPDPSGHRAPPKPRRPDRNHFGASDRSATPTLSHFMRAESSMSMRHYESGPLRSMSPNPYGTPAATTTSSTARMPHEQSHDPYAPRGHSRDHSGKSSRDMGKPRAQKNPSQKAMLSRALQKANTAVQLDNAQNFEGAREAYAEACDLLQQVLDRTPGDEDKRKLEAIHQTYTSRIDELDQLGPWQVETVKALPARPESEEYSASIFIPQDYDMGDEAPRIETARVVSYIAGDNASPFAAAPNQWQQSGGHTASERLQPNRGLEPGLLQSSFSRAPRSPRRLQSTDDLRAQHQEGQYAPPPLSPRSQSPQEHDHQDHHQDYHQHHRHHNHHHHERQPSETVLSSYELQGHVDGGIQNSWLDPIDESGGSTASSVHSRTSSLGYRRRHIRAVSGNTEAEFDTALDAAIEAAYDDGYEPMDSVDYGTIDAGGDNSMAGVLHKVEMARERARQTEQEAYDELANLRQAHSQNPQHQQEEDRYTAEGFYEDDSSEEEERLLDEITRDFAIEDFTMENPNGTQVSARQQDAWNEDETRPDFISGVRSFSALSQRPPIPQAYAANASQPAAPPPTSALPDLPPGRPGQNPKQLKIETANIVQTQKSVYDDDEISPSTQEPPPETLVRTASAQPVRPPIPTESFPSELSAPASPTAKKRLLEGENVLNASPSIHRLRKNFSSSSLRSMKNRNMSVSHLDDSSDASPGTPLNDPFNKAPAVPVPALPTPLLASFKDHMEAAAGVGFHLFDDEFHAAAAAGPQSPQSPRSPVVVSMDVPVPLEPCPNDFMLRPFWLMRCLYQTLVHPKGGYISTKLFVPRDVWRVKGVKIKNVEDKIANCDFLTAALLKLSKVDTLDADAVLEEMQALEGILEQIQPVLARKLGNEVGVQGSGLLFKDASMMEGDPGSAVPRSGSVSGKASAFSWRRLRPKTSGVGLGGSYSSRNASAETKEASTLATVPMTPKPTSRSAKRDVSQVQFIGPNASYMGSLARLFDAAQAVDQIARQVDDPGLRLADKTQVGLELCTRHAAEFFGFYICRFVLADLGLLLDKFLKRGSEWVMT